MVYSGNVIAATILLICLQLNVASLPPLSSFDFLRRCPNVKEFEHPASASGCPKAKCFRRAFDSRRFEHLRIGFMCL
ncbi:hypothetical protein F5146DRAFT_1029151 [Armillaria mellea]|nr:hypothetical protein F5146DRAFT_1029151 [Armillaria mellea]